MQLWWRVVTPRAVFFLGLALTIMLILSLLGRRLGGFRMGFYLIGTLLGFGVAWLLPSLGGPVAGLLWDHPLASHYLSPVVVFLFILGVTIAISEPIYFKSIYLHYKYTYPEEDFFSWEDFNHALGTSVGLLLGVVLSLILALCVRVVGYTSVQLQTTGKEVSPPTESAGNTPSTNNRGDSQPDPFLLRTINQFYNDLQNTGLNSIIGWLDPTPKSQRLKADLFGIIYHNPTPEFYTRLFSYPDLIAIRYQKEVDMLLIDAEFRKMLNNKAGILNITRHEGLAKVWRNDNLRNLSERINLTDLLTYLQTGESKKFALDSLQKKKLPIVFGRWRLHADQTFSVFRTKYQYISQVDQRRLYVILQNLEQSLQVAFATDTNARHNAFSVYLEGTGFPAQAMFRPRRKGAGSGLLIMQPPTLPPPSQRARLLAAGKCSKAGSLYSTKIKISGQDKEVEILFQLFNQTLLAYIPEFNKDPYCFVRVNP